MARTLQVRRDLHEAPHVAGGDDVGAGCGHGTGFRRAQCLGDLWLLEVIEAGRPAADLAIRNLPHREVANRGEKTTGRRAHVLRV